MFKSLSKAVSGLVSVVLVFGVLPPNAFAAQVNQITNSDSINIQYMQDMQDQGFSKKDSECLYEIDMGILRATSSKDIDYWLSEYHEIIDRSIDNPMLIHAPNGGTLDLTFNGKANPIAQLYFTKVIYMTADQVVFYQRAMNDPSFIAWFEEYVFDAGAGVISAAVAKDMALTLGLSGGSLSWIVGASVSAVMYIFQNIDVWDINDAIDRSTTGKLKLEYGYLTSSTYPYYVDYQNFEPWNDNYAEVPAKYNHTWHNGEFIY